MIIKQILHGLSLNIKIYLPETSNIQRREAELNIVSTSVNKFDVQQKSIQYLLCYKLLFKKNERNEKVSVQKIFH